MTAFQLDDIVRCVNADHRPDLTYGALYEVGVLGEVLMHLRGVIEPTDPDRFTLVHRPGDTTGTPTATPPPLRLRVGKFNGEDVLVVGEANGEGDLWCIRPTGPTAAVWARQFVSPDRFTDLREVTGLTLADPETVRPEEPAEFGARAHTTLDDGTVVRLVRDGVGEWVSDGPVGGTWLLDWDEIPGDLRLGFPEDGEAR